MVPALLKIAPEITPSTQQKEKEKRRQLVPNNLKRGGGLSAKRRRPRQVALRGFCQRSMPPTPKTPQEPLSGVPARPPHPRASPPSVPLRVKVRARSNCVTRFKVVPRPIDCNQGANELAAAKRRRSFAPLADPIELLRPPFPPLKSGLLRPAGWFYFQLNFEWRGASFKKSKANKFLQVRKLGQWLSIVKRCLHFV